jgi:uncharacterized membrane protein
MRDLLFFVAGGVAATVGWYVFFFYVAGRLHFWDRRP